MHIYALSPEKHEVEVVLLPAVKYESFLQGDSIWICVTRLAQSTQNNTLAISLQCLKENEKNEIDLLLADKHQRFLQNDTIIIGVCDQACPNHPK